jgi:hypothetical protein
MTASEDDINKRMFPEAFNKPEYVICAAILFQDGIIHPHQPRNIPNGFVICGRRHHNCFTTGMIINDGKSINDLNEINGKSIQGFLTSKDRFVDRKEGGKIAFEAGQIKEETDCMFSEDLY